MNLFPIISFENAPLEKCPDFTRKEYPTAWRQQMRRLSCHELYVVSEGTVRYFVDGNEFLLRQHDALVMRPGVPHSAETANSKGFTAYYAHFQPVVPTHLFHDTTLLRREILARFSERNDEMRDNYIMPHAYSHNVYLPAVISLKACRLEILSLLDAAVRDRAAMRWGTRDMLDLHFRQILILLTREALSQLAIPISLTTGGRSSRLVQEAVSHLAGHLDEPSSVTALSATLGVSPQHLIRMFKRRLGVTPNEFRQHQRVERAKELISLGGMTLKEIGHAVGFENQHYFCRVFKKLEGMTPGAYGEKID